MFATRHFPLMFATRHFPLMFATRHLPLLFAALTGPLGTRAGRSGRGLARSRSCSESIRSAS